MKKLPMILVGMFLFTWSLDKAKAVDYIGPPITDTTSKPGDANADGRVDQADYIIWLCYYRSLTACAGQPDFNHDNKIDGADYIIWRNNYGK